MVRLVIYAVEHDVFKVKWKMKTLKIGDNVEFVGAMMSRNKEYIQARTGKIVAIDGNEATIKARDGSTFHCVLESLIRA